MFSLLSKRVVHEKCKEFMKFNMHEILNGNSEKSYIAQFIDKNQYLKRTLVLLYKLLKVR